MALKRRQDESLEKVPASRLVVNHEKSANQILADFAESDPMVRQSLVRHFEKLSWSHELRQWLPAFRPYVVVIAGAVVAIVTALFKAMWFK